ncbi:MAG: DUF1499 domain-containing protein [Bauldia sp.]|nr:DUF1499 domain-containing protein [Bauldia sp.]
MSRLARWSARSALVAVVVLLAAAVGHRSAAFPAATALGLLAIGFVLALGAVVMAVAGLRGIWRDGRAGFRPAIAGLLLGIAVLAYPGALIWRVTTLPALSDIATDLADPPLFADAPSRRAPGPSQAALQADAYPQVTTRHYATEADEVFAAVMALLGAREWVVTRAVAPIQGQGAGDDRLTPAADGEAPAAEEPQPSESAPPGVDGIVEAVARTGFVGFEEDVVIRMRPAGSGAVVDMRSASRVFDHDFGSNARRITEFLRALDSRLRR